jgi:hypothetical protein
MDVIEEEGDKKISQTIFISPTLVEKMNSNHSAAKLIDT